MIRPRIVTGNCSFVPGACEAMDGLARAAMDGAFASPGTKLQLPDTAAEKNTTNSKVESYI
ncbi:MAG: hypothetical protein Hals2KO_30510 [Halioglobus sp.]